MDKKNEKLNVEFFDQSTIPKFRQEHSRFCLWKLVMKPGKTKPDKIPYQLNGKRADATNPQHYSSFEETVETFANGDYAGIGVGCFEPLRLVDVDDCVVNGKLDTRGQDIVDTLDSYTELSPSGTGIHIFILADGFAYDSERYYINNRNTHVEVYSPDATGKFLTLTGKSVHGADVNERSEQLQVVLDKYMKRPDADVTASVVDAPGSFLSDESVYAKASKSKQADKFNALWNGEIPDGKSPSEEAGHYKKATEGKDINFMIVHKPAVIKFDKHTVSDIIPASANPSADADIAKYRKYGIVDVYQNKVAGIYLSCKQ